MASPMAAPKSCINWGDIWFTGGLSRVNTAIPFCRVTFTVW